MILLKLCAGTKSTRRSCGIDTQTNQTNVYPFLPIFRFEPQNTAVFVDP